jgi:DNA repair protein RadC
MSTIAFVSQFEISSQDDIEGLTDSITQYYKDAPSPAVIESSIRANCLSNTVSQLDDNLCLVEYLNHNKEFLNLRPFTCRSKLLILAEGIIGNGLISHSKYIVVIRNRKSGNALLKSDDRQLIRYLSSGCTILGITLLDYIINGKTRIFSARESGILLKYNTSH